MKVKNKYYLKLVCLIILFIFFVLLSLLFIDKSLVIQEEKNIFYEEYGTSEYKVYLKDNIYYEEDYLGKDMSYIASLIDYISVDFDYKFVSDTLLSGEYYYNISADLEIINSVSGSLFYSKKFILLEEQRMNFDDVSGYNINENIKIDYDYYNSLANGFKSSYGVNASSDLKVYLDVYRKIDEESVNNSDINGNGRISLTIPLSEKAINISMNSIEIEKQNVLLSSGDYKIDDVKFLVLGLLFLIMAIIDFAVIVRIAWKFQGKINAYDKILKKILRQYDRLIVNTNSAPDIENSNITVVDSFFELLDARDNLHKPIFYYEIIPHSKCCFFIKNDNDLIIYTLKGTKLNK